MSLLGGMGQPGELRSAIGQYRSAFVVVALLSAMLNFLLLGGSVYMMLVYDSVLPSHSLPTLFGLLAMLVIVYAFQGAFDHMRSRILGDVANAFDQTLSRRVQDATARSTLAGLRVGADGLAPMRDLASVRAFLSSNGPATLIDMPWIFFFVGILALLNPWLGLTALVGSILLVALTYITERIAEEPSSRLSAVAGERNALAEAQIRHVEMLTALGMRGRMMELWDCANRRHLATHHALSGKIASLGGISRIGRMLLQSVILTVGALLVIRGDATGGVIFASSLLSARALAPVDQAIANFRSFAAARNGWQRLDALLRAVPEANGAGLSLPTPTSTLAVQNLFAMPPGSKTPLLHDIGFTLDAGDALAIVGPSAAGKSSLARTLLGLWSPARGSVRLDGAALDQWDEADRGTFMGYLPQTIELLEGTIGANIARFEPEAEAGKIIAAARAAGVHDMIVNLPAGYDTMLRPGGIGLSLGQQQRIALARALYGDPFLIVLDEPNSNLDAEGEAALQNAVATIRARGGIVVIIAHRPSALANVNKLMVMRAGRIAAFGPRDEILARFNTAVPAPMTDITDLNRAA